MRIYAHTGKSGTTEDGQTLEDHLSSVAEQCSEFAKALGYQHWGYVLGLLHDAGKSSNQFQSRLKGSSLQVDHSTAGAQLCVQRYGGGQVQKIESTLMALAIAGHHGGLPNVNTSGARTSLRQRLNKDVPAYYSTYSKILRDIDMELPVQIELEPLPPLRGNRRVPDGIEAKKDSAYAACSSYSLQILGRMLFSCLVDADYLDTERFISPEVSALRKHDYSSLDELLVKLEDFMRAFRTGVQSTPVNEARMRILADCIDAASCDPGLFTLSVPTGGGKTLSSMQFALRHAILHGKRRVIYAIPFTSVAQQTAEVFRNIFGKENVLEHHSGHAPILMDDTDENETNEKEKIERLAAQNWDAPIVVTTNVQLLESLYSNKPSKCRKNHNIAGSVLIFDEAQALPDALLKPTLAMLEDLCIDFSTTVVLCTATQPALEELWPFGSRPREISKHSDSFREVFSQRVRFEPLVSVTPKDLADELMAKHQVLCVVGTKKKAYDLFIAVTQAAKRHGVITDASFADEGFFHLSTNMVAKHRRKTLGRIRDRLSKGERCVVISTQLIEAGVDVDFPEAYRELAGIDSLLQVAGRCNREGLLTSKDGELCPGVVHVFEYNTAESQGQGLVRSWLESMKSISRRLLIESGGVVSESLVAPFFADRYTLDPHSLDRGGIYASVSRLLSTQCESLEYERYAEEYQIIEDTTEAVYVAWDEEGRSLLQLMSKLSLTGESSALFLPLQQYAVKVYPHILRQLSQNGDVEEVGKYHVLVQDAIITRYSEDTGLLSVDEGELNNLII